MDFKLKTLVDLNVEMGEIQEEKFIKYYKFLTEYNEITNLTRITRKNEVFFKHFFDSLTLAKVIDFNKIEKICDMGSGAGFPSIPLKIIYPHLEVVIVEASNKRIEFLKQLAKKLNLENLKLVHNRIETYALDNHEAFDLVTARALGKLPMIFELGIPMTRVGGKFIAMKGTQYMEELEDSKKSIDILGGELESVDKLELPYNFGSRVLIKIKKTRTATGYPRKFSVIKKKPL